MIPIDRKKKEIKNFHNERIPVYPRTLKLDEIKYWKENDRTIVKFEILEDRLKKNISKISLEEIVDFLSKQKKLEIPQLAESINNNDLKVPLIVLANGKLLDGNRRYFACYYLKLKAEKANQPLPDILNRIPVWIILMDDIDKNKELKILAEANFVYDHKVDWTDDVRAKVINRHFKNCLENGMTKQMAYDNIKEVYGVSKQRAKDYIETKKLTKKFIKSERGVKKRNELKDLVQHKFVYFWEFKNKSTALHGKELDKVQKLFFLTLKNGQLNNIKLIEPMIWAIYDDDNWKLLEESKGVKLRQIEARFKEEKVARSAGDKIQDFTKWLTKKNRSKALKVLEINLVTKLYNLLKKILGNKK